MVKMVSQRHFITKVHILYSEEGGENEAVPHLLIHILIYILIYLEMY